MESDCSFKHINIGNCKLDSIAGRSVHWVDVGQCPVVVLVHGGQAWAYTWRYQNEPLAAAGYRVIVPDLPGSGYSDLSSTADYSISALSSFLGNLLDELKVQKAAFAASSAGGLPVLDFSIRFPERVAALILVSACGVPHDLPVLWKLVRWPIAGELMGLFLNEGVVETNLKEAFYDIDAVTNEMVSAYFEPLRRNGAWKANVKLEREGWDLCSGPLREHTSFSCIRRWFVPPFSFFKLREVGGETAKSS